MLHVYCSKCEWWLTSSGVTIPWNRARGNRFFWHFLAHLKESILFSWGIAILFFRNLGWLERLRHGWVNFFSTVKLGIMNTHKQQHFVQYPDVHNKQAGILWSKALNWPRFLEYSVLRSKWLSSENKTILKTCKKCAIFDFPQNCSFYLDYILPVVHYKWIHIHENAVLPPPL